MSFAPQGAPVRPAACPARFAILAPGRVNLIGEHTDYNQGFVLPMAIDRGLRIAVRRRDDSVVVLRSESEAATARLDLTRPLAPGSRDWTAYPSGVIAGFQRIGWDIPGFEAVVSGNLPAGGGLSSSAALEVAMATAVETLCGQSLPPQAKALLCQRAEHDFAGVPCGMMDQFAVTLGRAGHALLLDCRSQDIRHVPLDDRAIRVLVINSGVRHDLADGEYAKRRAECAAAAARLGCASLRDVTPDAWRDAAATLPDVERRRAAHVLSENARVLEFVAAIGSRDWSAAGQLMLASHASLRGDYEVSCRELDLLVDIARATRGVFGCRMTGGGFGGCAVALVDATCADAIQDDVRRGYRQATGIDPAMFVTMPADGARLLA